MISTVRETIKKFSMLRSGQRVLAGVSGGPDSMAMLHALFLLREELGVEMAVAHLNHNLRGAESRRDMEFVREKAGAYGLEFFGRTLRAGAIKKTDAEGPQAAARQKRLAFLFDAAKKYGAARIALGHTMDDQAETMLMRFMKGSGLAGLSGMWPLRGLLMKPLLGVRRAEVLRFIEEYGLAYIVDSSNLKDDYLRNRIRHHLLPYLEDNYNPSIIESLARTAESLRHDNEYIEAIAGHLGVVIKKTSRKVVLDAARLQDLHQSLLIRVFLGAAGDLGRRGSLTSAHIDAFLGLVKGKRPNAVITLPRGLYAWREYGRVVITTRPPSEARPFDVAVRAPGKTVIKGVGTITASFLDALPVAFRPGAAYLDASALPGPLRARSFRPGDRINPLGMEGTKKVKEIFIDERVPLQRRTSTPIVYAGDEVLWVAGLRQSGHCSVREDTKKILKLVFRPAGGGGK